MGAKLEIVLYQKGLIDIKRIIKIAKKYKIIIKFNSIEYIEDWTYKNQKIEKIDNKEILNNMNNLCKNRITIIRGKINNSIECGLSLENEGNNIYDICGWFDILNYKYLNDSTLKQNWLTYDLLTKNILDCINGNKWYFCGIGIETFIKKKDNIQLLFNESSGVYRWILPEKPDILVAKYEIKEKYNVFILDKIK